MPELHDDSLDVSAEEERYLRSAFRRFALPYLALVMLIAMGGVLAVGVSGSDGSARPETDEMQSLVAESASLREALAALREELRQEKAASAERIAELEGRIGRLQSASRGGESPAELGNRLDHAHQRINALEGRLKEVESSRLSRATPPAPAPSAAAVPSPPPVGSDPGPASDLP